MSYDIYNKTELTGVLKLLDEKHVQYVTMYAHFMLILW